MATRLCFCRSLRRLSSGAISVPKVGCRLSSLDAPRSEVLWKSRTREWMEMNYILGGFAERHVPSFTNEQVALLAQVLRQKDHQLFPWISGHTPVPTKQLKNEVMVLLLRYVNERHPALQGHTDR
eukprot:s522_g9.t1